MKIKDLSEQYEDYIIKQRRYFHQHPELSWQEIETTNAIEKELLALNIKPVRFQGIPGLMADICGKKPGKKVLLRADIDALPITEKTGVSYASCNPGVMHACGHDTHIAMLLGAARILKEIEEELEGSVRLIFQASEEGARKGAKYLVEEMRVTKGVDACFGIHIWGDLDAPYMNFQPGNRMASGSLFKVIVNGITSHGAMPYLGKDSIIAACNILTNLQIYVSMHNDANNPLVITVGKFNGGTAFNTIANQTIMEGTARNFSNELAEHLEADMREIVTSTAKAHGVEGLLEFETLSLPVINHHDTLNQIAIDAAETLYGSDCLKLTEANMGGEDFCFFMEAVPGIFGLIGARNADKACIYTNHHEKFNVDETVLKQGAAMHAQFAYDYLRKG